MGRFRIHKVKDAFSAKGFHQIAGMLGSPYDAHKHDRDNGGNVEHFSWWSNYDHQKAHEAASAARAAAIAENQTVAQNIDTLRSMYGTYQGTDPGLMQDNANNAAALQGNYDHYKQAYLDYFTPQVDDQYNTASHNDLFSGINSGTAGGSADEIRRGKTLNTYTNAKQQLASHALGTVNDLIQGDHDTEMQLESQIQHGGDASYAIQTGLRNSQAALTGAKDAIGSQALGDIFNNAGSLYDQSQRAQGYGRNGLGMSSASSGRSSNNNIFA